MPEKLNQRTLVGASKRENEEALRMAVNKLLERDVEFIIKDIHYPRMRDFVDIVAFVTDSEYDLIIQSAVLKEILYDSPKMIYRIDYYRNDGSYGAYCGDDKDAFLVEIKTCLRANWSFKASANNNN